MSIAVDDEGLMRRFLLDDVGDVERRAIEDRLIADSAYYEALNALEEELMLMHLRGKLPAAWQPRFAQAILVNPSRRKRLEELARLDEAVAATARAASRLAPPNVQREAASRGPARWRGLAIAASLATAIIGGGLLTCSAIRPISDLSPHTTDSASTAPVPLVSTFVVAPGASRAELGQANIFRIPEGVSRVELSVTVDDAEIVGAEAVLRPVDGGPPSTVVAATVSRGGQRTSITVSFDRSRLTPGDYVLGLTAQKPNGAREPLPSAFFSVV